MGDGELRIEREGLLVRARARLPVRELPARLAEQPPGLHRLGVELHRAEQRLLRGLPRERPRMREAQLVGERGVVGLLLRRAREAVGRLAELPERQERVTEPPVEACVLREEARRLAVRVGRLGGLLGRLVEPRQLHVPLPPLRVGHDRALERRERLLVSTELLAGFGEGLVSLGVGAHAHALHQRLPRVGKLPRHVVPGAELQQRVRIVGAKLDRLRVPLQRVVLSPETRHRASHLAVQRCALRESADGLLVGQGGFFVLARGLVESPELLVALLVVRIELEGPRRRRDGFVAFSEGGARFGQVLVGQRVVRAEPEARLQGHPRRLPALPLHLRHAQRQADGGVLRHELHRALQHIGGLLQQHGASLLVGLGVGQAHVRAAERGQHLRLVGERLHRRLERPRRFPVLAERDVDGPEAHVPVGPRRLEPDRRLVGRRRLVWLAQGRARLAERLEGAGVLGPVVRGVLQVLARVLVAREEIAGEAQLVEGLGLRRGELHRLRERVVRLLEALQTTQREADLRVDARIVGEVPERGLVRLDGRRVVPQGLVDAGDGHVHVRPARLERHGALVGGQGLLVLVMLRAGSSEELVGLGDVLLQADRVAQGASRILPARDARERATVLEKEIGALGSELGGALVHVRRLRPLRDARVAVPRLLERIEVLGLKPGHVVVRSRRHLPALESHRDLAERDLGVQVIRLEGRRGDVRAVGVIEVADRSVGGAELQVSFEVVRLVLGGARVRLDGLVGLAEPLVGRAELEAGVRVGGIDEEARLQQVEELLEFLGLAHEGEDDDNSSLFL